MGRFRGLPAVLAMLLGGAALALAAGAVAYALRSRARAGAGDGADDSSGEPSTGSSEDPSDTTGIADRTDAEETAEGRDAQVLVDRSSAELAETEAASEAALEFQALEAEEPAGTEATSPDDASRSLEPPSLPARRAQRTLTPSTQLTLVAAAVIVGALVGLMLFLLSGGTIGR
jgi:hypothetical protein